jgi:hypothetical protein
LSKLRFQLVDNLIAPRLNFILPLEQLPPQFTASTFQLTLLLLPRQLFFECRRRDRGGTPHLLLGFQGAVYRQFRVGSFVDPFIPHLRQSQLEWLGFF